MLKLLPASRNTIKFNTNNTNNTNTTNTTNTTNNTDNTDDIIDYTILNKPLQQLLQSLQSFLKLHNDINNFDNVVDYDTRTNPEQSKFLKIQNKKLTDYTECRTNRVLIHDDISNRFSSRGFEDPFVEIEEIDAIDTHVRYTIQVVDPDTLYSQITELVLQTSTLDSILFEK